MHYNSIVQYTFNLEINSVRGENGYTGCSLVAKIRHCEPWVAQAFMHAVSNKYTTRAY